MTLTEPTHSNPKDPEDPNTSFWSWRSRLSIPSPKFLEGIKEKVGELFGGKEEEEKEIISKEHEIKSLGVKAQIQIENIPKYLKVNSNQLIQIEESDKTLTFKIQKKHLIKHTELPPPEADEKSEELNGRKIFFNALENIDPAIDLACYLKGYSRYYNSYAHGLRMAKTLNESDSITTDLASGVYSLLLWYCGAPFWSNVMGLSPYLIKKGRSAWQNINHPKLHKVIKTYGGKYGKGLDDKRKSLIKNAKSIGGQVWEDYGKSCVEKTGNATFEAKKVVVKVSSKTASIVLDRTQKTREFLQSNAPKAARFLTEKTAGATAYLKNKTPSLLNYFSDKASGVSSYFYSGNPEEKEDPSEVPNSAKGDSDVKEVELKSLPIPSSQNILRKRMKMAN